MVAIWSPGNDCSWDNASNLVQIWLALHSRCTCRQAACRAFQDGHDGHRWPAWSPCSRRRKYASTPRLIMTVSAFWCWCILQTTSIHTDMVLQNHGLSCLERAYTATLQGSSRAKPNRLVKFNQHAQQLASALAVAPAPGNMHSHPQRRLSKELNKRRLVFAGVRQCAQVTRVPGNKWFSGQSMGPQFGVDYPTDGKTGSAAGCLRDVCLTMDGYGTPPAIMRCMYWVTWVTSCMLCNT